MEFLHQLGTLDFWKTLLDGFGVRMCSKSRVRVHNVFHL